MGKRYLVVATLLYLVYAAILYVSPVLFVIASTLWILGMALGVPILETRYRTEVLLSSLPLRRSTIAVGRYVSSLFALVLGGLFAVAYGRLLGILMPPNRAAAFASLGAADLALAAMAVITALSIAYPLYFRFGLGRGLYVGIGSAIALGIGATALDANWPLQAAAWWERFGNSLRGPDALGRQIALAWLLVGMMALSSYISVRLYRSRDFN